jgi:hypothetical protein
MDRAAGLLHGGVLWPHGPMDSFCIAVERFCGVVPGFRIAVIQPGRLLRRANLAGLGAL